MRRSIAPKESDLFSAVADYLTLRERQGDLYWSITDPASPDEKERGRRVRPGWSDITVCVRGGRFLGIELKRPEVSGGVVTGGKPRGRRAPVRVHTSEKQLAFRTAITALGGTAVECRSVADVARAIEKASHV